MCLLVITINCTDAVWAVDSGGPNAPCIRWQPRSSKGKGKFWYIGNTGHKSKLFGEWQQQCSRSLVISDDKINNINSAVIMQHHCESYIISQVCSNKYSKITYHRQNVNSNCCNYRKFCRWQYNYRKWNYLDGFLRDFRSCSERWWTSARRDRNCSVLACSLDNWFWRFYTNINSSLGTDIACQYAAEICSGWYVIRQVAAVLTVKGCTMAATNQIT